MNVDQRKIIDRLFHQPAHEPSMLLSLRLCNVVGESPPITRWDAWDAMVAYIREHEGLEKPGLERPKPKKPKRKPPGAKRGPKRGWPREFCTATNPASGLKCRLRAGHKGQHKRWFPQRTDEYVPPEEWGEASESPP